MAALSLFLEIRGLEQLWAQYSLRARHAPRQDQRDRMLFDLLGIGLEQGMRHLASERPSLAAFADWVVAAAGPPDPVAVARYHAWLDRAPPPPPVQTRIAAIEAMPPVLDSSDLAQWDAQGWVILRHAVPPETAAAAARLLWTRVGGDPEDPASWYGEGRQGIMVQQFQHPAQAAARDAVRIHKAFAQLWGSADLWVAVDRMSFNPPETATAPFQGTPLHWDVSLAWPIPFATQGILYLTDTAPDQGALRLVPGFHRRIEAWLNDLGDRDPRAVDLTGETVAIGAGVGDLVIWRQDLPHGASPNRSDRPRLAQYVNLYSPDLVHHPEWR
ncbi:phytanoyl-CoA dioxygenase family protein [Sphingomonas sp. S2-65]|uniref:phytanoyl-CoA dioxygenase family protein n=1 Tax=Sphingomonas sp. S2-65 TaxID=2903960 RepID=UPI001F4624E0|nr:phytanoyl-CoA dioxygenase family protein [Sphingomonas sp. S2-65]UYY57374.1 phytanoyl-CoA dioxygenase family protein [Sphingomonas sp. S2-65]